MEPLHALDDDFECLVFMPPASAVNPMEKLVDSGDLTGVIDITTTEVRDLVAWWRLAGNRRPVRGRIYPHPRRPTSAHAARSTW